MDDQATEARIQKSWGENIPFLLYSMQRLDRIHSDRSEPSTATSPGKGGGSRGVEQVRGGECYR